MLTRTLLVCFLFGHKCQRLTLGLKIVKGWKASIKSTNKSRFPCQILSDYCHSTYLDLLQKITLPVSVSFLLQFTSFQNNILNHPNFQSFSSLVLPWWLTNPFFLTLRFSQYHFLDCPLSNGAHYIQNCSSTFP